MVEINVTDVIRRLHDLRFYSAELSRKLEHEVELPEDAAPFLIERIEAAMERAEKATVLDKADAYAELGDWLQRSYRYYIARLAMADQTWTFRFPSAVPLITH